MGAHKTLCMKAGKMHGEGLRRQALLLRLLDLSRKPKVSRGYIFIPVTRRPLEEETASLRRIAEFKMTRSALPMARPPPKGLSDLLAGALPPRLIGDLPRSYDAIGDIVVVEEISKTLEGHEEEIGEALLRMIPNATTCLLKVGKVEGERRIPTYEAIAGIRKSDTVFTEYGVRIKVDLAKVYFSPRLGFERQRIARTVSDGETVVDMFAGVGPFSLAIAKRADATVHSIDINPDAIELLITNISLNRLRGKIHPICGDAAMASAKLKGIADHVVMNLPGSSLEFMDAAISMLKPRGGTLHVYTFSVASDPSHAGELVKKALEARCASAEIRELRVVKEVAPRKWQIAVDVFCSKPKGREAKLPRRRQA